MNLSRLRLPVIMQRIPGIFAPLYEKAVKMAGEAYYRQVAQDVVSDLKGGKILDLGTGPGYLPIEIARNCSTITIEGIDLSARLIETAKENAFKEGLTNRIHFQTGNAATLNFPDAYFDMVISTGMLHMLRSPVKVLDEIFRVLKPGGEAWIYDPARISSQIKMEEWRASLSLWERITFTLFLLFAKINPPRKYRRDQVIKMISQTNFKGYEIAEERGEMRIKLVKST